ncbi:bacteriocin immunity protein [Pectobacterium sp. FL60-S17]|uniref:Bacteriocin immunity protein n=1 Tax=Pectobacterium quasiaquaticum TaxID=2774015 RepID=A0A9Q2ER70_9GAMM|nr:MULTISPECIES: bacteriocin immunity protein [Pectobacterium]MBE5201445.1 bacteriocin immunity protein [Pectobacterium quasiaquaticum]MBE5210297.1 bacteriocin immunity protein [Pectobacterium quasiaquaticum]MBE5223168.1 bacteriocin immunity protein [Pectobacterium quasiaquaticum]MBN3066086.1 bacteriocin immunity protein [Pectobacterium aquaticum]URG48718.1 bacteriocin immunity protein [Pectobacterium quasiaquaticum]
MNLKENIEDYTEEEFIFYLKEFFDNPMGLRGKELETHLDSLVEHFDRIVLHPEGNGLIFYPPDGREDSPEGVLNEIKRWRKSQGLPLFKDSK